MREFLKHPLFWIREGVRWHWSEIIVLSAATWAALILLLIVYNALT